MKLDYLKMLEDINLLVESGFCEEMCAKSYIGKYDALKLAKIVGKVYLISHCTHCEACQGKYKINLTPND
jgi:hypothetical protein